MKENDQKWEAKSQEIHIEVAKEKNENQKLKQEIEQLRNELGLVGLKKEENDILIIKLKQFEREN